LLRFPVAHGGFCVPNGREYSLASARGGAHTKLSHTSDICFEIIARAACFVNSFFKKDWYALAVLA